MPDRNAPRRNAEPCPPYSVDLVLLTPHDRRLAVLLRHGDQAGDRWTLPWDTPKGSGESLGETAQRIARKVSGHVPGWLEQVGAFSNTRHPSAALLSVAFAGLVPAPASGVSSGDLSWVPISDAPKIPPRQREILERSVGSVSAALDHGPIAFRLLPETFTLSELQQMYELLLGKRLHKASFRRALQAALLVEATDEWRSEGRGRPAQLYRYNPPRRRVSKKSLRFDFVQT